MKNEYLITNRLGAYSSSTFDLGNTRKYHGILVVSNPNIERKVIVNRLEEKIEFRGRVEYLNTNIYKDGVINPQGYKWLRSFNLDPDPTFSYLIDLIQIKKFLHIAKYENKIEVIYQIDSKVPFLFTIIPLITNRSFHSLSLFDSPDIFKTKWDPTQVKICLSDTQELVIEGNYSEFMNHKYVYYNFEYPIEKERGYDYVENLISLGELIFNISSGKHEIKLSFAYKEKSEVHLHGNKLSNMGTLLQDEITQDSKKVLEDAKFENSELTDFVQFLLKRSESFIVANISRNSIIAGYHWFEDWGRDTFISFRGLLLCRGYYSIAKSILLDWIRYIQEGLIPNRPGLNEYNSIDATLWYLISIYYYWIHTNDDDTIKSLMPQISNILQNLILGTKFGIHTLRNGLLISTDSKKGLTWMDALVDGTPVTPRIEAAVEIQMLWFNVLSMYKEYEKKLNASRDNYYINLILKNLKNTFDEIFWIEEKNYLADWVKEKEINKQIRPNPVIGMCLPFKILSDRKAKLVLDKIEKELFTKLGLKTLNSADPQYKSIYSGGQVERDLAYHNGTVWPWLLGLYLKSYLNVYGKTEVSKKYIISKLIDFWRELKKQELNYIPEIFSAGDLKPNGCLSQAWNYATLIEVIYDLIKV